jgi:hypothetical protein
MVKYIVALYGCAFLYGCGTDISPEEANDTQLRNLPHGSIFIKRYDDIWIKWSLDGECFMSMGLGGEWPLIANVSCEPKQ